KTYRVRSPGHGLFGYTRIRALDGVSLQVHSGAIVGIVGESGCGKSTLARCLVGLETPENGNITIAGHHVAKGSSRDRRALTRKLQMVFQDPYASLSPRWTIEEILEE